MSSLIVEIYTVLNQNVQGVHKTCSTHMSHYFSPNSAHSSHLISFIAVERLSLLDTSWACPASASDLVSGKWRERDGERERQRQSSKYRDRNIVTNILFT